MFDVTVFSPAWPKALFLSKKFSDQGKKVCYIDLRQEALSPLGAFIQEDDQEEKWFLESLGLLEKQEGGFCLLSPEACWSFQEIDWQNSPFSVVFQKARERAFGNFKNHWLASLSRNLMSRIFEGNHFFLSEESLNFFSDYFLFEPSLKQKKQFQLENPKIHYMEAPLKSVKVAQNKSLLSFLIEDEPLESHKFLWLAEDKDLLSLFPSQTRTLPEWEWKSFSFEGDLGDYSYTVPSHFVSLKDLSLPWTHDNLLSVFHRSPHWEVWFKQAYGKEDEDLLDPILVHLHHIFKGAISFEFVPKKKRVSFCVYGQDQLQQKKTLPKNIVIPNSVNACLQGDLLSQLKCENSFFKEESEL